MPNKRHHKGFDLFIQTYVTFLSLQSRRVMGLDMLGNSSEVARATPPPFGFLRWGCRRGLELAFISWPARLRESTDANYLQ